MEMEVKNDMRTPDQRQSVVALRLVCLIDTRRRLKENALVWEPDIKFGIEFHGFRRAPFEPASAVRTVTGQALPEHLDQKLHVRQVGQCGKFVL